MITRTEALAQNLMVGHRQSVCRSAHEIFTPTPRKQWLRSSSIDFPTEANTSLGVLSPADNDIFPVKIK